MHANKWSQLKWIFVKSSVKLTFLRHDYSTRSRLKEKKREQLFD